MSARREIGCCIILLGSVVVSTVCAQQPRALPDGALAHFEVSAPAETNSSGLQIRLSPDGRLLAVRKINHSVQVWDLSEGKKIQEWNQLDGIVLDVCITGNNESLFIAKGRHGTGVRCLSISTGELIGEANFPASKIGASSASTLWALGSGTACEIDATTLAVDHRQSYRFDFTPVFVEPETKTCFAYDEVRTAFGSDEQFDVVVLSLGDSDPASQFAPEHHRLIHFTENKRPIAGCISRGGYSDSLCYLLSGFGRVQVKRLDQKASFAWDAGMSPTCIATSSDGRFLACGGTNGRVKVWEMLTRELVGEFEGTMTRVMSILFSSDNSRILTCSAEPGQIEPLLEKDSKQARGGVTVWDFSGMIRSAPEEFKVSRSKASKSGVAEAASAWSLLAEINPMKARAGIEQLLNNRAAGLKFVDQRIRDQIRIVEEQEIATLVRELSAEAYEKRSDAYRKLVGMGEVISDQLEAEEQKRHPLETRLQLRRIISQQAKQTTANNDRDRQIMRAIWYLEQLTEDDNNAATASAVLGRIERWYGNAQVRSIARSVRARRFGTP